MDNNIDKTWENLGEITLYHCDKSLASTIIERAEGTGILLYKYIPNLGKCFKVIVDDKVYAPERNKSKYKDRFNAYIGAIGQYLSIVGFE